MTVTIYKLVVETSPEVHAQIFINDADTGQRTPYTFELAMGIYKVSILLPAGYLLKEWQMDGISVTRTPELEVNLTRDTIITGVVTTTTSAAIETVTSAIPALMVVLLMIVTVTLIIELIRGVKW